MIKPLTVQQFFRRFPSDDACLDHLMAVRYGDKVKCPKCGKTGKFHRIRRYPAYECAWCGYEIYPMVGTPFERTHTSLQKWFYAMYLFTSSRHGVSAKELQRQLGVTYKTAWRMGHEIRKYMGDVDGDPKMTGHVEVDETLIGGKKAGDFGGRSKKTNKSIVFGIIERDGEVFTQVVPDVKAASLIPLVEQHVTKGTRISSDEWTAYLTLGAKGYKHKMVRHGRGEYARGDIHTNTIENFWAILKRSIRGTHIWVSRKHLQKYLGEFEFRYNLRKSPHLMFDLLLLAFPRPSH